MKQKQYLVRFEINVSASSPRRAAADAWDLLASPGSSLPVADVLSDDGSCDGKTTQVDLQKNQQMFTPMFREWLVKRDAGQS